MGVFGGRMYLTFVHRKGEIWGGLGEFHAFEGLQVGQEEIFFSYQWARSPGLLLSLNVLPEASRFNCRTPSGEGLISPSVPSWGVLAKNDPPGL